MYAGHAALALFAKSRRPRISLALLVPVAFAPDWIEWLLSAGSTVVTDRDKFLSHSLVSVVPCALAAGLLYWLVRRGASGALANAATVCALYLSHWAADFITGIKPTWHGGPMVGLMFYTHVWPEALMECALVLLCWWAYHRSLPPASRRREIGWVIPAALIGLEIVSALLQQPMS